MSKIFHFAITQGVNRYLSDTVDFHRCENSVDAFNTITQTISEFRDGGANDVDPDAMFEESDWRGFFERGCAAPDASMWSFTLAQHGAEILSLTGKTEAEYECETECE